MSFSDQFAAVLFLVATGISLTLAGVGLAGWKDRRLIRTFFAAGIVLAITGVSWPAWFDHLPTISMAIASLSSSSTAWFSLLAFTSAAFLFTNRTKQALEDYISRLGPERKEEAKPKDVWKQAYVWRDGISGPPQFCFTFAENGRNARLYVDLSSFYAALNDVGWTQTVRLEVKRFDYFARDQTVRINLFEEAIALGAKFWRFTYIHDKDDSDNPEHLLTPASTCRGRYSLLTEDGREFYCYFVIEVGSGTDKPPHVIGQDWFDHAWKWEA